MEVEQWSPFEDLDETEGATGYTILWHFTTDLLAKEVNEYLEQGYKLQGGVNSTLLRHPTELIRYSQAMVRK